MGSPTARVWGRPLLSTSESQFLYLQDEDIEWGDLKVPFPATWPRADVLSSQEPGLIPLRDPDSTPPPFQASKHVLWSWKCVCPWLQANTHVPGAKNSKTQGRDRNQKEQDGAGVRGRAEHPGRETQPWGSILSMATPSGSQSQKTLPPTLSSLSKDLLSLTVTNPFYPPQLRSWVRVRPACGAQNWPCKLQRQNPCSFTRVHTMELLLCLTSPCWASF